MEILRPHAGLNLRLKHLYLGLCTQEPTAMFGV